MKQLFGRYVTVLAICACVVSTVSAGVIHVSKTNGKNSNPGTKESPLQEIDKAISLAQAGDEIRIAGGVYSGTFGIGYLESAKPIKMYGSYDQGFSTRDLVKTPTLFQPDNESGGKARKAFLKLTKDVDGTIIDGIVFDMGLRNAYSPTEGVLPGVATGRMLRATERPSTGNSTGRGTHYSIRERVQRRRCHYLQLCLRQRCEFWSAGRPSQGHLPGDQQRLCRQPDGRHEIFGTCASTGGPGTLALCGDVEIAQNTILFTWSRLKDFKDMGYGIRIMTKCRYNIHHNIIGGSVLAGVDHSRFNKNEWVSIDDNTFFVNKQADLEFSPASNTKLNLRVEQFGDLEIASAKENNGGVPKGIRVDKAYLEGFLSARYTEQVDFNPNSPANVWREIMGLNKQGKISSQATMFMNRYPVQESLKLFGAVAGCGAQAMK